MAAARAPAAMVTIEPSGHAFEYRALAEQPTIDFLIAHLGMP